MKHLINLGHLCFGLNMQILINLKSINWNIYWINVQGLQHVYFKTNKHYTRSKIQQLEDWEINGSGRREFTRHVPYRLTTSSFDAFSGDILRLDISHVVSVNTVVSISQ